MYTLLTIFGLSAFVWFWFETMKVREHANRVALQSCKKYDVQFLDGTVAFAALKPVISNGLRIRRVFVFDYSEDGENRKEGFLVFVGNHLTNVGFQAREIH